MRSMFDQLLSSAGGSGTRQVVTIAVGAIDPDPDQPRKTFQGIDELAASIQAIGIKQPLLVRAHPEDGGRWVVVSGERRYRAAREAGLEKVPCLVEEDGDRGLRLITQLAENLQREDVPVLETARALELALEELEVSKGELAKLLGKSAAFVSRHLALLKARGPGREALEEGRIQSPETYRLFAGLASEEQAELLSKAREEDRAIARSEVSESRPSRRKPRPRARKKARRAKRLRIELRPEEIAEILRRFGIEPPQKQAKLVPALLDALRRSSESEDDGLAVKATSAPAGREEVAPS